MYIELSSESVVVDNDTETSVMFCCLIQIELVNISVRMEQGIDRVCTWPSNFTLALHVKPEV